MSETIFIGWINNDGAEKLSPAPFNDVESASFYIEKLNESEQLSNSGDVWFVMVGVEECPSPCAEDVGTGQLHHWLFDADDDYPEGRMVCRHCETWRTVTDKDEE